MSLGLRARPLSQCPAPQAETEGPQPSRLQVPNEPRRPLCLWRASCPVPLAPRPPREAEDSAASAPAQNGQLLDSRARLPAGVDHPWPAVGLARQTSRSTTSRLADQRRHLGADSAAAAAAAAEACPKSSGCEPSADWLGRLIAMHPADALAGRGVLSCQGRGRSPFAASKKRSAQKSASASFARLLHLCRSLRCGRGRETGAVLPCGVGRSGAPVPLASRTGRPPSSLD